MLVIASLAISYVFLLRIASPGGALAFAYALELPLVLPSRLQICAVPDHQLGVPILHGIAGHPRTRSQSAPPGSANSHLSQPLRHLSSKICLRRHGSELSGPNQIRRQRPLKLLHPNRHLQRIKRILHDLVRIDLITPPHHHLRIRLFRARKEQELHSRRRLEASQPEVRAFQTLDAGGGWFPLGAGWRRGRRGGIDGARDGVDAVEGAGKDQVVVAREVLEAGGEGARVDEAAGFVDDQQGKDDPSETMSAVRG